jgi:hypothetical protein
MIRRLAAFAIVVLAVAPLIASTPARADELPSLEASYSADWQAAYGEQRQIGRVYHVNGSEMQALYKDGEETPAAILRADEEVLCLLFPDRQAYVELPVSGVQSAVFEYELYYFDAELVGRETMDGEAVSKYHVTGTDSSVGTLDLDVWVTDDGIYMRIEGEQTSGGVKKRVLIVKTNIERGPQDATLFQPPADYDKLAAEATSQRN